MRVVLDTNIYVSGIFWDGSSRKILRMWLDGGITVIVSLEIVEEIIRILKNFKIPLSHEDIELWESLIFEKTSLVEPEEKLFIVQDDSDDNKFFEAAIAGDAEYIISQDKHLLRIEDYQGINVVLPEEFMKIVE